ncbi:MAG: DinB family protein [Desulfamplus sp.]|nr:DinB family protein [Desulfamplus sp.]
MSLDMLRFLGNYNSKINQKMNEYIKKLSEEEWNTQFSGYFNSIQAISNHIYTCDYNWLKRFSLLRKFHFIENTNIQEGLSFKINNIDSVADYMNKRDWLDNKIIEFIEELNEEDLKKDLLYQDSSGIEYVRNFGLLVLHMFNHETHHRGVISHLLEELKIDNDFSNIYDII